MGLVLAALMVVAGGVAAGQFAAETSQRHSTDTSTRNRSGPHVALALDTADTDDSESSVYISRGRRNRVHEAPADTDDSESSVAISSNSTRPLYPVVIHRPEGPPRVPTGEVDMHGNPVTVSCASCHANLTPQPGTASGDALREFHQGLVFAHGRLTCLSCHHAGDYNRLRLADGRPLDFPDVQTLCAQCHAPQARDYEHGAHGGMQGYWDLTRGPRQRKNCIDCHDPHAPAFPQMLPSFRPQDRFLSPRDPRAHHD